MGRFFELLQDLPKKKVRSRQRIWRPLNQHNKEILKIVCENMTRTRLVKKTFFAANRVMVSAGYLNSVYLFYYYFFFVCSVLFDVLSLRMMIMVLLTMLTAVYWNKLFGNLFCWSFYLVVEGKNVIMCAVVLLWCEHF